MNLSQQLGRLLPRKIFRNKMFDKEVKDEDGAKPS
jgi:hypothetical protein